MSDDPAARLAALEQLDEDLFDFPDVEGMAELLATSRAAAASGNPAAQRGKAGEPKGPLPAPRAGASKARASAGAGPQNAGDLDEDLFGFGELFELSGAAGVGADAPKGDQRPPVAATDAARPEQPGRRAPSPTSDAAAPAASQQPSADPAKAKERKPKDKEHMAPPAAVAREAEAPVAASRAAASRHAANAEQRAPAAKAELAHASAHSGAPFMSFPTSIDLPPARSKLLWVLVGCFLLANGGVFLMTQQQNQSVNQTLVAVTSTLAEAVARGANAAPYERAPGVVPSDIESGMNEPQVPRLDPADYTSTNELGLHNARRLIEQGAYTEARRNLFFILANQDRSTPLTPTLREDIDYLIALTYYDQGRSIAVEDAR